MILAETPPPPYYAVIFTSVRTDVDTGYADMADRMVELAAEQPGFLGVESARQAPCDGPLGITVSYWDSLEAIKHWRLNAEHTIAREQDGQSGTSRLKPAFAASNGIMVLRRIDITGQTNQTFS